MSIDPDVIFMTVRNRMTPLKDSICKITADLKTGSPNDIFDKDL